MFYSGTPMLTALGNLPRREGIQLSPGAAFARRPPTRRFPITRRSIGWAGREAAVECSQAIREGRGAVARRDRDARGEAHATPLVRVG